MPNVQDLHFLCHLCHRFAPITGKPFCALCVLKMLAVAQKDQTEARIATEVKQNPELGLG